MHPELLHWGILHIRSYGLMLAIAFLAGTWLALLEARRRGLDEDRLVTVILLTLVASILGARALYVLEHIGEFRREWGSVLALWQGGLTLYGGVVLGTMVGLAAARRLAEKRAVHAERHDVDLAIVSQPRRQLAPQPFGSHEKRIGLAQRLERAQQQPVAE